MARQYILNNNNHIKIGGEEILSNYDLCDAINFCNSAIRDLHGLTTKIDINIFEALGMRNLSGLIGEYFAKSVQRFSHGALHSNLHQDGYPDLLLTNNSERLGYFNTLYTVKNGKKYPVDKIPFSPFKYGGIEVKATCGNTPPARRVPKPLIGEQRISITSSFEWKAHHRETNYLLAILWDFIDEMPTVAACFYRNDLVPADWGRIVQPREGGGRTTSVSIMTSDGVRKMCQGWLAVINDRRYIAALANPKWIGFEVDRNGRRTP